jgi:hypothetical protein
VDECKPLLLGEHGPLAIDDCFDGTLFVRALGRASRAPPPPPPPPPSLHHNVPVRCDIMAA